MSAYVRLLAVATLAGGALAAPLSGAASACPFPVSTCVGQPVGEVVDALVPDRCYSTEHGIYCEEDPA